jgi:NhaP-type Na+/H+ or K+/H+ antiporter
MTTEAIQILLALAFGIAFGLIVGWVLAMLWEKRK